MRRIADEVGAHLLVDMAHIAGLVAGGAHPTPIPHAHVVSTTTHKSLRGPRGAMLLCKEEIAKSIDKAVFPGLQGGPHNHTTAGIAVALKEAATDAFKAYAHQIVKNARALAEGLADYGFKLISGGTDTHLILMDVTPRGMTGKAYARALDRAGLECNYNTVPGDPRKPFDPSGLRLGTPSVTSRGMAEPEMARIAGWFNRVAEHVTDEAELDTIAREVRELCAGFPCPGIRR
jgi:glycine hydroxymethyltransferase